MYQYMYVAQKIIVFHPRPRQWCIFCCYHKLTKLLLQSSLQHFYVVTCHISQLAHDDVSKFEYIIANISLF